jgi:hypothetical protein
MGVRERGRGPNRKRVGGGRKLQWVGEWWQRSRDLETGEQQLGLGCARRMAWMAAWNAWWRSAWRCGSAAWEARRWTCGLERQRAAPGDSATRRVGAYRVECRSCSTSGANARSRVVSRRTGERRCGDDRKESALSARRTARSAVALHGLAGAVALLPFPQKRERRGSQSRSGDACCSSRAVVSGVVNETLAGVWVRACPWSTGLLLPCTVSRARSQGRVGCLVLGATGPQEKAGQRAHRPTDEQ